MKRLKKFRSAWIGLVAMIAMLFGVTPWAQDIFAAEPSLYLKCEGNMISETGLRGSADNVGYGPGPPGMGQAAEFKQSGSATFSNNGVWVSQQGSFAAWIKPRGDFNSDRERHDIFSLGQAFGFFLSWIGKLGGGTGNVAGSLMFVTNIGGEGTPSYSVTASVSSIFSNNGWHHVAITWGSAGKKIYVDGALKASGGYSQVQPSLAPVFIGKSSHFGQEQLFYVNSWMDEILFYTTQLSDSAIRDIYGGDVDMTPQGTIAGRVTNSSGNGLPGIKVTANPGSHEATTSSGGIFNPSAGGDYTLPVPEGTYEVRFSGSGYRTACYSNVEVSQGETITLNVQLNSGSGEEACVSYGGVPAPPPPESPTENSMCSEGSPLYFYFVANASTMTMLSVTNPCPDETANASVTWYIGEGADTAGYESGISIPPLVNIMATLEILAGSEGWMIVESANTHLFGNETICDSGEVHTVLDLPSFTPRERWTILYFTSMEGWTTRISLFNPNDVGLADISIKAYDNSGNLIETSPVTTLPSKYQVIRQAQDFFNGTSIGNGWIEVYSPNGPILAFGYTSGS